MDTIRLNANEIPQDLIRGAIRDQGYAIMAVPLDKRPHVSEARDLLDQCLAAVGQPIQVFDKYPTWRPIGVDTKREPSRSEGVGESPLHMDFVNAQSPPEYVLLYCERDDPLGGGDTYLAPTAAVNTLSHQTRRCLAEAVYSDGRVVSLHNIGSDINPFAVAPNEGPWPLRYTGQLLRADLPEQSLSALRELDAALWSQLIRLRLNTGEAILLDQRRILHGRAPLGVGQENVPLEQRRQLWQRFGRDVTGAA